MPAETHQSFFLLPGSEVFWKYFSTKKMTNICIFLYFLLVFPPVSGQESSLGPTSFISLTKSSTWKEAQSFCRENYIDLVTILNEHENQAFFNMVGWLGLYRENKYSPWKWSRGNVTATFIPWASGEPQDYEHCGFKWSKTSKWINVGCDGVRTIMCFHDKLVLVKENKTWEEALEHCRSLGGVDSENPNIMFWKDGYDLATLITEDDHNYAREQAQQATTDEVWTGLRYLGDEWFWVGGESMQYQNIPSCPAVQCGVLEKSSTRFYGTRNCSQRRNFFCYKKPSNY